MDDTDFNASPDNEWEDRGELAWNEFDWERYLRAQDEAIHRYLGFYEAFRSRDDRIDLVAAQMGWEPAAEDEEPEAETEEDEAETAEFASQEEVYTLHKNPVFVATKAIVLSIKRPWEILASQPGKLTPSLAVSYLAAVHRSEDYAMQAIHALDFGDYAMAISLLKRSLGALNDSLNLLSGEAAAAQPAVRDYAAEAKIRLFDLREVWLRVIAECRRELGRAVDDSS